MRSRTVLASLAVAAVLSGLACSSSGSTGNGAGSSSGPLGRAFDLSADQNGVPRDLMVAIAQTEGSLDMPRVREVMPDAAVPVAGPMQLRHGKLDTLSRGAALMKTTELALRQDSDLALEAGARVLAEVGARTNASADDLATWQAALEEMSGYADDHHRQAYAHRVFGLLARGGTFEGRDGESIAIAPHDIPPALWMEIDTSVRTMTGPADYGPAEWFPTSCNNKCTPGRAGNPVQYVVIHDTEGGWDASVATLQNDPGKSVQYIVGTDGRVGQFIHEVDTAWHAGNFYYNERSVGIEHVGYANKPYTNPQYTASAKLVDYLTHKYNVAKDRAHIIGHDQIPDGNLIPEGSTACSQAPTACESSSNYGGASNHRDPGIWEWATYMARFGGAAKCNDAGSLLNCSNDKTQAYRCQNGKVEVLDCTAGCVPKPNGQDDVCNVKPASTGGGSGRVGSPNQGLPGNGTGSGSPVGAPSPGGGEGAGSSGGVDAPAPAQSGGCSVTPGGGDPANAAFGPTFALLGLALALVRRRRGAHEG